MTGILICREFLFVEKYFSLEHSIPREPRTNSVVARKGRQISPRERPQQFRAIIFGGIAFIVQHFITPFARKPIKLIRDDLSDVRLISPIVKIAVKKQFVDEIVFHARR